MSIDPIRSVTAVDRSALSREVLRWIDDDPDPEDRAELERLLAAEAMEDLAERFAGGLEFGTAGLRGKLGAGPARLNRATVRKAVAGLASYLLATETGGAVVIGHDARRGSAAFAEESARVLTGAGLRALCIPGPQPTPLLAFAVRQLDAAAGIMVTASHNPPDENGLKVYLRGGAQIAPPQDAEIAGAIDAVGRLSEVALGDSGTTVGPDLADAYLDAILAALPAGGAVAGVADRLRIVYTPLHGVGRDLLLAAFSRAGLPGPEVVAAQAEPDGAFPTLSRPNPEEPGTLDLALAAARETGADLLLANDPDADRLAAAVPEGDAWRVLSGDEIGALLASYRLRHCGRPGDGLLVSTVASSTLVERMAAEAGVAYRQTLTGFKWIMGAVADAAPRRLLLGYEEALGYAVSDVVRDKDGISAAVALCRAALEARASGRSLLDELDALAVRFGAHRTRQLSVELSGGGAERAAATMRRLRGSPPERLAGRPVTEIEDRLTGPGPRSDVLVLTAGDVRVVVRPSGTEPKLKSYLQAIEPVHGGDARGARTRAEATLDILTREMRERLLD